MLDDAELLSPGDLQLAADPDLRRARQLIEAYESADPEQSDLRRQMLDFIDRHPLDAHRRSCREGHLTASALVVEEGSGRVLLMHHRKLGKWLQLGGHCDGDANLAGVALREAIEESGIEALAIAPQPIDLDIHPIPARPGEPAHLHLDTRFAVLASRGAEPRLNHEAHALRWFRVGEALTLGLDDSLDRLLRRFFDVS